MDIQTLPGARWSCRGCGDCCHGFSFGPVEPEVIADLEAADIAAQWPPAAAQPWHTTEPGPDGQPAAYLARIDGHCVFLQDDQRCAVHRLLGGARKPWFCREYPFLPVEYADGRVAVAVRGDCGGLHESFEDGAPVGEQVPEVLALPRPVARSRFDAPQVRLLPGLSVPSRDWRRLEPGLLARLSVPRQPAAAVADARAYLSAQVGRPAPRPDPARVEPALRALLTALLDGQRDPSPAVALASTRWRGTIPPVSPAGARYLLLLLRGALLTGQHDLVGGVPALMGLWLAEAAVSALRPDPAGPLGPPALGATLPALKRWLQQGERWSVLIEQQATLEALFDHAVETTGLPRPAPAGG